MLFRSCAQTRVCPLGVTGVELPGIPDPMKDAVRGLLNDVRQWLLTNLEAGRETGELSFSGNAECRADSMLAALQGSLQLARLTDASAFQRIVEQLRVDLGMDPSPAVREFAAAQAIRSMPA